MSTNIAIISEELNFPIDEGFKKVVYSIVNAFIKNKERIIFIGKYPIDIEGCFSKAIRTNKLFLNRSLFQVLNQFNPDIILYIPYSSITIASLIRTWILKAFSRKKVVVLALQPRHYPGFSKYFIPFVRPDLMLVLSGKSQRYYQSLGFKVQKIPLGVDINRFKPVSDEEKIQLRKKYGIPENKQVVLHIGHLKKTRNITSLMQIVQKKDVLLLLVTSTSTLPEEELKKGLNKAINIKIINWYVENIEEIYQLSDCYLFLVEDPRGCIEIPLSVLEAMACNLPVITTKFGGLPDWFDEEKGLIFVNNKIELNSILQYINSLTVNTRDLLSNYLWENITQQILNSIKVLIGESNVRKY